VFQSHQWGRKIADVRKSKGDNRLAADAFQVVRLCWHIIPLTPQENYHWQLHNVAKNLLMDAMK
jgi:hypothetical protein